MQQVLVLGKEPAPRMQASVLQARASVAEPLCRVAWLVAWVACRVASRRLGPPNRWRHHLLALSGEQRLDSGAARTCRSITKTPGTFPRAKDTTITNRHQPDTISITTITSNSPLPIPRSVSTDPRHCRHPDLSVPCTLHAS